MFTKMHPIKFGTIFPSPGGIFYKESGQRYRHLVVHQMASALSGLAHNVTVLYMVSGKNSFFPPFNYSFVYFHSICKYYNAESLLFRKTFLNFLKVLFMADTGGQIGAKAFKHLPNKSWLKCGIAEEACRVKPTIPLIYREWIVEAGCRLNCQRANIVGSPGFIAHKCKFFNCHPHPVCVKCTGFKCAIRHNAALRMPLNALFVNRRTTAQLWTRWSWASKNCSFRPMLQWFDCRWLPVQCTAIANDVWTHKTPTACGTRKWGLVRRCSAWGELHGAQMPIARLFVISVFVYVKGGTRQKSRGSVKCRCYVTIKW